jgi:hypothetical protein
MLHILYKELSVEIINSVHIIKQLLFGWPLCGIRRIKFRQKAIPMARFSSIHQDA